MTVSGQVQGVGFRWGVLSLAVEIGDIYGRVWNNDDGTVGILAQSSSAEKMSLFIQKIRKGPTPLAKVSYLDINMAAFENFLDFKIKY